MKIFIIYGKCKKESRLLCDFVQSLGHELVVLEQLPGKGRTIIEKLSSNTPKCGRFLILV